jgi:putative serine protease PepD
MKPRQWPKIAAAFLAGILLAGGGAYAVDANNQKVNACVNNTTRVITLAPTKGPCAKGTKALSWNMRGPQGAPGLPGLPGISADISAVISVAGIAARLIPSVVSISAKSSTGTSTGTGFITKTDSSVSYIVTNNHVVTGATSLQVEFEDGTRVVAQVVGADVAYDLAVLLIEVGNLPVVEIGDSSNIKVGQPVIAIGSPLALSSTVTKGIISAIERPVTTGSGNTSSFIDALQTDAAINPGNSGGPLVDASAKVIGINSAIATFASTSGVGGSIGIGFAIPVNQASRIANEIITTAVISNGKVLTRGTSTRPLLGITTDPNYEGVGARIAGVSAGGAAATAGIPVNGIIRSIEGKVIKSSLAATIRIRSFAPGQTISITVDMPDGSTRTFSVTLASAPSN